MSEKISQPKKQPSADKIPLFSEKESPELQPWILRTENIAGIALSVVWLFLSLDFLSVSGWWEARYEMTPPEYAGFLAGVLTPLALIWFVLVYFAGHKRYDDEAERLRDYLRHFLQPSAKEKLYAKSLLSQIEKETKDLNEACDNVSEKMEMTAGVVNATLEKMKKLSDKFDDGLVSNSELIDKKIELFLQTSAEVMRKINENTAFLESKISSLNEVAEKTNKGAQTMDESVARAISFLKETQDDLSSRMRVLADDVREQSRLLTHASEKSQELMSEQTTMITENAARQNFALTESVRQVREVFAEQSALIKQDILSQTQDLVAAQERLQDNVASLSMMAQEQVVMLSDASHSARSDAEKIERDLSRTIDSLSDVFDTQIERMAQNRDSLNTVASHALETFQKQNALLDGQAENVLARFKVVEASLENYIGEISSVSDGAFEKINAFSDKLGEKSQQLQTAAQESQAALDGLVDTFEEKSVVLYRHSKDLTEKSAAMAELMTTNADTIKGVLDNSTVQAQDYSKSLIDSAALFESRIESCGEKTKTLTDALSEKTSEIADLSAALSSQAMVTETSLNHQHKYLANAVATVEECKQSLKEQAQELFNMADLLEGKSKRAVEDLLTQMARTIEQTDMVVNKVNDTDVSLAQQADGLKTVCANISMACMNMDATLKKRNDDLNQTRNSLEESANVLAQAIQGQTELLGTKGDALKERVAEAVNGLTGDFIKISQEASAFIDSSRQASQTLNDKASELNTLFETQERQLIAASDSLADRSADIADLIRRQSEQAENDLERLAPRIHLLQEGFEVQIKELSAASQTALAHLENVGRSIVRQGQLLTEVSENAESSLVRACDTLSEKGSLFDETLKSSAASALTTAEQIEQCQSIFEQSASALKTQIGELDASLGAQVDSLQKQTEKSTKQAVSVRDSLQRQITELSDAANVVSAQSRLGEASLEQQTRYLREAAEDVMTHIRNINEAVRQNTNDLLGASSRIGFELDAMGENLRRRNDEAAAAAQAGLERSTQAAAFLREKADLLAETSATVISALQKAGQAFAGQTEQMLAAGETARNELTNTGETFLVQAFQLNRISDEAQKSIKGVSVSLRERAADFMKTAEESSDRVRALKDAVARIETEFEDMSNKGVIQIDLAGQRLRSMISEVASNSERIAMEVRKSGEQFVEQSDLLSQAADDAVGKLRDLSETMKRNTSDIQDTGDKISAQSVKLGGAFGRQVQALLDASKEAQDYIDEMDKRKSETAVGHFMDEATQITERLQSLGVDVARMFDPDIRDDLWKRYYSGDRSVFVRYLSRALDKRQVNKLSELFTQDAEFREYVSKYNVEFETLLQKAKESERGEVLFEVLMGSDAGRLYMVLSKVFGN